MGDLDREENKKSRSARNGIGWVLTAIWLLVMVGLLWWHSAAAGRLTLEGWGTFLGGVTGPLALMWLILGYLQQGEELRLNTDALRLQQEELRRQVEETAALVKHSGAQAQTAMEMLTLERERQEQATIAGERAKKLAKAGVQPSFRCEGGSSSGAGGHLGLRNTGGGGSDFTVTVSPTGEASITPHQYIGLGEIAHIKYSNVTSYPATFTVNYTDADGDLVSLRLTMQDPGSCYQERGSYTFLPKETSSGDAL
jgi:hypothetical protein